jgi:hypothetical protein
METDDLIGMYCCDRISSFVYDTYSYKANGSIIEVSGYNVYNEGEADEWTEGATKRIEMLDYITWIYNSNKCNK